MVRANEEALRYDSPVKSIQRLASQDIEMRGKLIRKDDRIRWFIPSANRDPQQVRASGRDGHHPLAQPTRLLRRRHPPLSRRHHRPRGGPGEVFRELAERYPDMKLGQEEMDYEPSITFRSIKKMPIITNA